MKKIIILLVLGSGLSINTLIAQDPCSPDSVKVIDGFEDVFSYRNIYIAGQPGKDEFKWYQSVGVRHVVNLRTQKENRKFSRKHFDAERYVVSLGINYACVPVGGGRDKDHPDKLGEVAAVLDSGDPVLLHCKSGARARYFLMAYLVRERDCSPETAKEIAKKMGYLFPLELMFSKEVDMVPNDQGD